ASISCSFPAMNVAPCVGVLASASGWYGRRRILTRSVSEDSNCPVSLCEKLPRRASGTGRFFLGPDRVVLASQLTVEPGPGIGPVTVRRGARDAEGIRRLLDRQPREIAQGHELRLDR